LSQTAKAATAPEYSTASTPRLACDAGGDDGQKAAESRNGVNLPEPDSNKGEDI
jgi:hypothetical protein